MKNTLKYLPLAALLFTACDPSSISDVAAEFQRPRVQTYSPIVNESAPVKPGTETTITGVNLENTAAVIIDGIEAQITSKSFKTLKFKVPMSDNYLQAQTYATTCELVSTQEKPGEYSWKIDYYVYLDPTDAIVTQITPLEGTIGTKITLTGYNLDLVSSVLLNGVTVPAASFVSQAGGKIELAIPAGSYTAGTAPVNVTIVWGSSSTQTVVTDELEVSTPDPDTFVPPGGTPAMGDELTFTGENLDLIDSVHVGNLKAVITSQSATEIKISIPAGTYDGAVNDLATVNITGYWGQPAQNTTLALALTIDVTVSTTPPTFTSVIPQDGGTAAPYKFYLRKSVAVTGADMLSITGIKVGTVDAEIDDATHTGTSLTFTMPDGVDFTTMTEQDITAVYGQANLTATVLANAKVYPFYYWKDQKLGVATYGGTEKDVRGNFVFFSLDDGRCIPAEEWATSPYFDATALPLYNSSSGSWPTGAALPGPFTMTAANTINTTTMTTSAMYYAVKPYILTTIDSSNKYTVQGAGNSAGQIRNVQYYAGGTASSLSRASANYISGTPVVTFRTPSSDETSDVLDGTIESLETPTAKGGTGAPEIAAVGEDLDVVLGMQWYSYQISNISGTSYAPSNAAVTLDYVLKSGFIVIKSASGSKTSGSTDLECTVDVYWPAKDRAGIAR